jgi:hypothetical protein
MVKRKEIVTHEESAELRWPEGQPRTRIQDRLARGGWKMPLVKAKEALRRELELSGATSSLLTYSADTRDPGVAVYFSRKPTNEYAWQEALGFIGEIPTVDGINKRYQQLARRVHPDGPTPDVAMFTALSEHRQRALDWVTGKHRDDHEYVIAIDVFNELRLNVNAVKIVLFSLRRIEDCGSPLMLERAFRGFHKQITAGAGVAA